MIIGLKRTSWNQRTPLMLTRKGGSKPSCLDHFHAPPPPPLVVPQRRRSCHPHQLAFSGLHHMARVKRQGPELVDRDGGCGEFQKRRETSFRVRQSKREKEVREEKEGDEVGQKWLIGGHRAQPGCGRELQRGRPLIELKGEEGERLSSLFSN